MPFLLVAGLKLFSFFFSHVHGELLLALGLLLDGICNEFSSIFAYILNWGNVGSYCAPSSHWRRFRFASFCLRSCCCRYLT